MKPKLTILYQRLFKWTSVVSGLCVCVCIKAKGHIFYKSNLLAQLHYPNISAQIAFFITPLFFFLCIYFLNFNSPVKMEILAETFKNPNRSWYFILFISGWYLYCFSGQYSKYWLVRYGVDNFMWNLYICRYKMDY